MSERERRDGDPGDPAEIFRALREGPAEDPESIDLWRRIEDSLQPRSQPRRPIAWRFAYGLAAAATVVMAVTVGLYLQTPTVVTDGAIEGGAVVDEGGDEEPGGLVILAEEGAAVLEEMPAVTGAEPATPPRRLVLDVRLVRGYDGIPPEDALSGEALAGAGGASAVSDLRPQLLPVLPYDDYALVARGRVGIVEGQDAVARLTEELSVALSAVAPAAGDTPVRPVRFAGLRLIGAGRPRVAGDLALVPGRLYLFGIPAPGEPAPSLVLAVRVSAAGDDD